MMNSSAFLQGWFWPFAATALVLVALFTFSLSRAGRATLASGEAGEGAPRGQAFAFAVGLPLLALALYAALGQPRALNPAERETGSVAQVESMVERLAERLKRDPGDVKGWLMLAHSYKVMGRAAESADAYEQADRVAPDTGAPPAAAGAGVAASAAGPAGLIAAGQPWQRDPNRLVDWIEVRMLASGDHFDARSLQLLRRAEALAPQHPGVLMLAGLAALDRRDFTAAQKAFTALRDQAAPGSDDRAVLDDALAKLAQGQDPRRAAVPDAPAASAASASAR